jgi:hypothetical protein
MSSVIQRLGMGDEKSVIQLLVSLNNLTSHCFQLLEIILQGKNWMFCYDLQIEDTVLMSMEQSCISFGILLLPSTVEFICELSLFRIPCILKLYQLKFHVLLYAV